MDSILDFFPGHLALGGNGTASGAYVDFALEVAKKLDLFASEDNLQETINFWKHYQRVQ